ncbi:hypothetical protein SLU01_01280 [Sporosarcina luteola]|uniref:Uncharacterized protein n=1 Tax=Sporosarcina luteola TaxID=582850 RepID=A0A511Z318_9BACL|nr:hypothetical protein SLU01_01280 [Sporosarcina luteola]
MNESSSQFYTDIRVDYGRDDVIKMAIYYQVNDDGILKGQSNTHLYLLKFLPINLKALHSEYKYSIYATSKLIGYNTPVDLGWGMTTGIFDESISNYGVIFGILLSLIVLILVCRLGDSSKNNLIIILTYITGFLLMILQATSFIFILFLWIISIITFYLFRISRVEY